MRSGGAVDVRHADGVCGAWSVCPPVRFVGRGVGGLSVQIAGDGSLTVGDAASRLTGDMIEIDCPNCGRGELPVDRCANLVLVLGAAFKADLCQGASHKRGVLNGTNGTRGNHTREARGEEAGSTVLLDVNWVHIHGDGDAHARVALPVLGLLASRDARVDQQGVTVQDVGERRGVGVSVSIDRGDDAVLADAEDLRASSSLMARSGSCFMGWCMDRPFLCGLEQRIRYFESWWRVA